jgi:glycerophosphoryl diester phosphodiesterase
MNYRDFIADPDRDCAVAVHRGCWREAPENSLLAIEKAIGKGYEIVEIDVRRSADGGYFLLHDDTLARMTGNDVVPETLSLAELRAIRLRDGDGGAGAALTGETIPDLRDVFALTRGRIFIDLDIKHPHMLPEVAALAREMGVDQEVDVKAYLKTAADLAWINEAVVPHGVPFMAKTHMAKPDELDLLFALGPFMSEIMFGTLSQVSGMRSRLADAGIALWYNSLDGVSSDGFTDTAALRDPEGIWGRLIDAGISTIQTDYPDEFKAFVAARRDRKRVVGASGG